MHITSSRSRNISFFSCWSTSAQLDGSWSYTWQTSPYSTRSSPGSMNALESRNISDFFFSALVSSYINNFEFLYNFEKCKNHTFMVLLISNSIINLERVFQYVLFLWHIKSSVEDIISNTIKNLGGILLEWS